MAKKMSMFMHSQSALNASQQIFYGNPTRESPAKTEVSQSNNKQKSSLSANSMISRIHNVRPGCGSCGK